VSILVNSIDVVGVWNEAWFMWITVHADGDWVTLDTIVIASGSVDGAGLIGDLVGVHPLEGVVSLTTVATIISRAGDKNLWGDVNIWPGSLSSDLDSIGES